MTLHAELADEVISHYGEELADTPKQSYDAVTLSFAGDLTLDIRFASADEYSLEWHSAGSRLRIDTAPLHPELTTFPNHLHRCDGEIVADPLTTPGDPPWENVRKLLDAVLKNPLLK